jgi:exodeoxyribonuclease VII small subunit
MRLNAQRGEPPSIGKARSLAANDEHEEGASQEPSGSFEEEMAALEEAVESLERGNLTLEKAIERFEDGFRALRRCYSILEGAQKRIETLSTEMGELTGADPGRWQIFQLRDLSPQGSEQSPGVAGAGNDDEESVDLR